MDALARVLIDGAYRFRAHMRAWCRAASAWSATRPQRALVTVSTVAAVILGSLVVAPSASAVTDPCSVAPQSIACENTKEGTPSEVWDITGAGDETIQGFATDMSVNRGSTISFKVKTTASSYSMEIYRLGYYGGDGARLITTLGPIARQNQPDCVTDQTTEIYDCGDWAVSASWAVPNTAVSGVYIARLKRGDDGGDSHIPFVVRNDASTSDIVFQTSDTTWQAYNAYGGSSFYTGGANGRAYKLSYNRPFATRAGVTSRDFLFSTEYPMIRFLERNGYDVSYTTGIDSDRRGSLIKNHKVFMSVGHDEYWSGQQRKNVEAARDAGVSLAFFSGNEVYWRTRWEASQDGSNTAYRTLVCYKETWANASIDPSSEWTGTWRDPRFTPPATGGGSPENALTGTLFQANHDDLAIQVPAEQGRYRAWRNTSVASMTTGQTATLAPHTVGYESDEDLDNGYRPPGLIRLSTTTGPTPEYLRDFGNTVTPGTTTHHMTLYRAASGALVFAAGTIQFAWGLDGEHDGVVESVDSRIQQFAVNLLADMGVQPATLMNGLTSATASTDMQAPTANFVTPAGNAGVTNGGQVTLQGTASDLGGGRVAGVEASTDGGDSWHPATGTTTWSYSFYSTGIGSQTVLIRAIDDSANIGTAVSRTLTLTGANTIFGARVPTTQAVDDNQPIELGVRFTPDVDGLITGVRFYKGSGNTGTHTGSIWSASGDRLKTGKFTDETGSGWQALTFSSALPVSAGTTYVASYYAPIGYYAADPYAFSNSDFASYPLRANRSTASHGNGLYRYGGGLPTESFTDSNYYVDVVFKPSANTPPTVVSVSPQDNAVGISTSVRPSALFSKALDTQTIQFTLKDSDDATVAGSVSYASDTKTVSFAPSAKLDAERRYTATVTADDTYGNPMEQPMTWSFTTDIDGSISKLFATNAVPAQASSGDPGSVELGVRFVPDVNGYIIGVRYYQGPGNTGTHTGSLWSTSGTRLAQATFPASTQSGWQTATFDPPVAVTAGAAYVASYFAPNGNYAYDSNFFDSPWTNGPLTAFSSGNGLYKYSATSAFPTQNYNSTNYWVDPLFYPGDSPPTSTPSPTPSYPSIVSIFSDSETPATASWDENVAINIGVRFTSDVAGEVTGLRFYKGASNTGEHVGSLWTGGGQLLANATFNGESASGWQTVTFSQPVAITAGTQYVASYHTTVGYYSVTANTFQSGSLDRAPLHVPQNGAMYIYGANAFPSNISSHNYWVDVVFEPNNP